ncbi:MAG: molybdopterin-dependent oxidoreductase [Spirochaetes bacterium]|nr:molybdopterin-dependent oxidoreductase [Spirochaetota bacterium]
MSYMPGVCTFCGTGCGHYLKVNGTSVQGVFPSRVHPVSKGRLCVRGWNIHELLGTQERIVKPYIRDSGEVNYKDAIAKLVSALSSYKPEEIAFYASPRSSNEDNFALMKLARLTFKTNNISIQAESGHRNSLDVLYNGTGFAGMLGSLEDIRKAEVLIVAGMDITTQNPIIGSELHYAARNGSLLITIDSRMTKIAKLSKKFINIKPGTMRKVFDAIGYYIDKNNLGKTGSAHYDEYKKYLSSIQFDSIEKETGVLQSEIAFVAEKLVKSKSAAVFFTSGVSGLSYDTIASIYNVFVLADKIGKEGCGVNPIAGINNLQGSFDMGCAPDLLTGFQSIDDAQARKKFEKMWGALPASKGKTVEQLLTDSASPLKALVIVDHDDGIVKYADRLKSLPFVAYIGAFTNKVAEFAHVVLPIATYIETDGTFTNTERRVQLASKKCEPSFDVLPLWKLASEIAQAAGTAFNYQHPSDIMDEIASLTPTYEGISYKLLAKKQGVQWPCTKKNPEGTKYCIPEKVSFILPQKPYAAVQATESYPYLLMLGKAQHYWHQNNIMHKTFIPLREYNATLLLYPDGYVAIAPEDAKKIGVRDRWPVKVVAEKASMKAMVMVSDDVAPGTAYVPYFIREGIASFLLAYSDIVSQGEEATIPVRIEKV